LKKHQLNDYIEKINHDMKILDTKISMIEKENNLLKSWHESRRFEGKEIEDIKFNMRT